MKHDGEDLLNGSGILPVQNNEEKVVDIAEQIKAHDEMVHRGEARCRSKQCPLCHKIPEGFKLREVRTRIFLAVIEALVTRFESYALRWMCGLCKKRFTELPEFAIPNKRHVKATVSSLSEEYLEKDEETYEKVVGGIGYPPENREDGADAEGRETRYPSLAPSAVWHWLTWLGEMTEAARQGKDRIMQKDPSLRVSLEDVAVCTRKYRSERRRKVLERAKSFLRANQEHERLFGVDMLPEFAAPGHQP
jgi:hypothetical protein